MGRYMLMTFSHSHVMTSFLSYTEIHYLYARGKTATFRTLDRFQPLVSHSHVNDPFSALVLKVTIKIFVAQTRITK